MSGVTAGTKVSRHELSARVPSIESLLAYEVIFDVPSRELFAGTFEKVERLTKERAAALIAKLGTGMVDRRTMRKLELLRRLASDDRSHGT